MSEIEFEQKEGHGKVMLTVNGWGKIEQRCGVIHLAYATEEATARS